MPDQPDPPVEVVQAPGFTAAVEVVEIAQPGHARVMTWEQPDPLAGAELLSVSAAAVGAALAGHEHVQVEPSSTWIVDHGLGRRPAAWSLFDAAGRLRDEFVVEMPTVNRAVVRMDVPVAGTIRMI